MYKYEKHFSSRPCKTLVGHVAYGSLPAKPSGESGRCPGMEGAGSVWNLLEGAQWGVCPLPHRHHGVASAGLSLQRMKWGLWAWVQGQSQASQGAGYRKCGSGHPNRSQKVRGCQGQGAALPAPRRSLEGREPHTLHPRCLGGPTAWHPPQSTAGSLYGGQANTALGWAHLRGPASMDWRRLLSPAHTCRSPLHSGVCGESRGAPS